MIDVLTKILELIYKKEFFFKIKKKIVHYVSVLFLNKNLLFDLELNSIDNVNLMYCTFQPYDKIVIFMYTFIAKYVHYTIIHCFNRYTKALKVSFSKTIFIKIVKNKT